MTLQPDDYRLLFSAHAGTGVSDEYQVPSAARILLHMVQETGTASNTDVQQKLPGETSWTIAGSVTLAALNENGIVVVEAPAGEIRFQITSNNGTVSGAWASHYGR